MVESTQEDTVASSSNTFINAVIGAIAAIVFSFIPFSTLIGGALAGYIEGGTTEDGLRVGAIAGLLMLIPFLLIMMLLLLVFAGFGTGTTIFFVVTIIAFLFAATYTLGLSILGGFIGVYLKNEMQ